MECPRCQTEVAEMHFFCPKCHTLVVDYTPEVSKSRRELVERVGSILIDVLLVAFVLGGSILIVRGINWREVASGIRETVDAIPVEKVAQKTRTVLSAERRSGPAKSDRAIKTPEPSSIESVRVILKKALDLPSLDALSKTASLAPIPVNNEVPRIFSVTENTSTEELLPPPSEIYTLPPSTPGMVTGIELIDEKQRRMAGFVSVNSLAPARIYVDGEFSGVTPRTIKLNPGDHQIWLIANGYEDWMRRVRLKSKQQVNIVAWLKKKPKS